MGVSEYRLISEMTVLSGSPLKINRPSRQAMAVLKSPRRTKLATSSARRISWSPTPISRSSVGGPSIGESVLGTGSVVPSQILALLTLTVPSMTDTTACASALRTLKAVPTARTRRLPVRTMNGRFGSSATIKNASPEVRSTARSAGLKSTCRFDLAPIVISEPSESASIRCSETSVEKLTSAARGLNKMTAIPAAQAASAPVTKAPCLIFPGLHVVRYGRVSEVLSLVSSAVLGQGMSRMSPISRQSCCASAAAARCSGERRAQRSNASRSAAPEPASCKRKTNSAASSNKVCVSSDFLKLTPD